MFHFSENKHLGAPREVSNFSENKHLGAPGKCLISLKIKIWGPQEVSNFFETLGGLL